MVRAGREARPPCRPPPRSAPLLLPGRLAGLASIPAVHAAPRRERPGQPDAQQRLAARGRPGRGRGTVASHGGSDRPAPGVTPGPAQHGGEPDPERCSRPGQLPQGGRPAAGQLSAGGAARPKASRAAPFRPARQSRPVVRPASVATCACSGASGGRCCPVRMATGPPGHARGREPGHLDRQSARPGPGVTSARPPGERGTGSSSRPPAGPDLATNRDFFLVAVNWSSRVSSGKGRPANAIGWFFSTPF
jgi:hypothetical protein